MPRVSVLLPVHNGARYLPACLRSLSRQDYRDFEVVAVDDGSDDDSAWAVGSWMDDGSGAGLGVGQHRLRPAGRLLRLPHRGLPAALESGLAACDGELIARMDADDIAHPARLRLQVAAIDAHPEWAAVGCQVRLFPRRMVSGGMARYQCWLNSLASPEDILCNLFVESPLCHPGVLFRAADVQRVGGYRERGWPEDYDLWMRLACAGRWLGMVPRFLLAWREHGERSTRSSPRYESQRFLALKLHFLLGHEGAPPLGFEVRPGEETAVGFWGAGETGKPWLRALHEAGVTVSWVVDVDRRKLGCHIHHARVITPEELPPPPSRSPRQGLLVAVGADGARQEIRGFLRQRGWQELRDFVCLA